MIVYKYLDEEGTIKTLKSKSVLLRSPNDYNDPFDCLFAVSENDKKQAYKLYENYLFFEKLYTEAIINNRKMSIGKNLKPTLIAISKTIKRNKKYSLQEDLFIYSEIAKKLLKTDDSAIRKKFNNMIDIEMKKIRDIALVSCFSLKNDCLLMWSHYANKHKGSCIEYEVDEEDVFKKVDYSNKLSLFQLVKTLELILGHKFLNEEVDGTKKDNQFVLKPLYIKADDWIYEEEVRCVFSKRKRVANNEGLYLLEMPRPNRIIVGCNAEKKFVDNIKNVCGNVPVIKAKMSKEEYKIIID